MATISETGGEGRVAELKRKMQESAKQAQAKRDAEHSEIEAAPVAAAVAETAPVSGQETSAPVTATMATTAAIAEAEVAVDEVHGTAEQTVTTAPIATTNGAVAPAAVATTVTPTAPVEDEEANRQAEFTRREFLTYAWGAAMGLLVAETALVSYFFMYPRFRAGEFGGKFFLSETEIPPLDAPPASEIAGKFWLVDTDTGPRALYMVCTHLGCLYKWEASNNRFECPCHGSKFSKSGYYIEGPAPRSLDSFELTQENGQVTVDTGKKTVGSPSVDSPSRAVVG